MKEFLDDLTTRDQRMMFAVLTMVHTADTKEQLDNDTEALLTTARKHLCQFGVLKFQQLDGLNTAMPFGVRKIESFRTLTTESLAVFIPFRCRIFAIPTAFTMVRMSFPKYDYRRPQTAPQRQRVYSRCFGRW